MRRSVLRAKCVECFLVVGNLTGFLRQPINLRGLTRSSYNLRMSPSHAADGPAPNQGCTYRERLDARADGESVLDYLSRRYRHSSPEQWTERIAAGQVLVDGSAAQADTPLRVGSELIWQRPPWVEPEAPCTFSVLYEDDDLLAVAKPAGLPTLPGANFLQSTLLHQVQRYAPDAAPVHRLGRWTSGVVLCTRNAPACTRVMRQWSAKETVKRYRALASGYAEWNELTESARIGPVPHALLGTVHAATPRGKAASSHIVVLERRGDGLLCDVYIATGRPHQIRIHLAAVGHPLVGDPLYIAGGVPTVDSRAVPGDPGYLLHAAELRLSHPRTGCPLVIQCEPPLPLQTNTQLRR